MKFLIKRAWNNSLESYAEILDKYGAIYGKREFESYRNIYTHYFAEIELSDINELINMTRELNSPVILEDGGEILRIYDDYLE